MGGSQSSKTTAGTSARGEGRGHALGGSAVAVLGASGGLGSAIARALAGRGSRLLLAGRDPSRLGALGLGTPLVGVDVRDPGCGQRIAEAAVRTLDGLDGLIDATGVVAFGSLLDHDDDTIEELFLTNAMGPLWPVRGVLPLLEASRGFVAQLSAVVAERPPAGMSVSAATRAALTATDDALARELRAIEAGEPSVPSTAFTVGVRDEG